jgi:hypothetical protein
MMGTQLFIIFSFLIANLIKILMMGWLLVLQYLFFLCTVIIIQNGLTWNYLIIILIYLLLSIVTDHSCTHKLPNKIA